MTDDPLDRVVRQAMRLPSSDLRQLTTVCRQGPGPLARFRASVASMVMKEVCSAAQQAAQASCHAEVAGVLEGVRRASQSGPPRPEVVWTGPEVASGAHRLTGAVVADLVAEARESVLLVSFAMHGEHRLARALERVAAGGVSITLLAERAQDNPDFKAGPTAFVGLGAIRYAWPAAHREAGASLHAKLLVVDRRTALVGSANITRSAMEKNLECGVIIRDRSTSRSLVDHVEALRAAGHLVTVPG